MSLTSRGWSHGALSLIVVGLSAAVLSACQAPAQQEAPPPTPIAPPPAQPSVKLPMSYNALMVAMVDNAGHVLWDIEKEGFAPKNEADWAEVENHGMQLAAAATLLRLEGAGPADGGWVKQVGWTTNAEAMAAAGMAASIAAKSKNKDALIKANGDLVAACEGCHKAFKPELPTEGIAHQRPHSESHKGNQ
jgi:hypothetical protein